MSARSNANARFRINTDVCASIYPYADNRVCQSANVRVCVDANDIHAKHTHAPYEYGHPALLAISGISLTLRYLRPSYDI